MQGVKPVRALASYDWQADNNVRASFFPPIRNGVSIVDKHSRNTQVSESPCRQPGDHATVDVCILITTLATTSPFCSLLWKDRRSNNLICSW